MILNFLKKKKSKIQKVKMQLINVKKNNVDVSNYLYIGKFVSIESDISRNDNLVQYIDIFQNREYIRISKKISSKYEDILENSSNYGLIYQINDDSYDIAIICEDGFIKQFKVELNFEYMPGKTFIIDGNNIIDPDSNKIVGIGDFENYNIALNILEGDRLVCFIRK